MVSNEVAGKNPNQAKGEAEGEPKVKQKLAEGEPKGEAEGEPKGEAEGGPKGEALRRGIMEARLHDAPFYDVPSPGSLLLF